MTTGSSKVSDDLCHEVLGRIDEGKELLAETCLELGNTDAPLGHKQPVAGAVSAWHSRHDISSFQQEILPERSNDELNDLVACAKTYALTALDLCVFA